MEHFDSSSAVRYEVLKQVVILFSSDNSCTNKHARSILFISISLACVTWLSQVAHGIRDHVDLKACGMGWLECLFEHLQLTSLFTLHILVKRMQTNERRFHGWESEGGERRLLLTAKREWRGVGQVKRLSISPLASEYSSVHQPREDKAAGTTWVAYHRYDMDIIASHTALLRLIIESCYDG
ncbi:hypothetical protein BHE74_00015990 [Ensete ventricosum]|uniref:Uncharacterized protein n=1 Tax=Ensete ventricosum TaxID=4639 RepID=A0A445MGS5_ENSVE|nr:hypothetical protein BHE74_00015990 [Ensete ventricosum]RZR73413.1 hypothetical protein BHM03_00023840 [Ensete ventricosum]